MGCSTLARVTWARKTLFRSARHKDRSALAATAGAFNVPLKCSPEETKHFVEPAMNEAESSNFAGALEVVNDGLNAHHASEGLLFLRRMQEEYFIRHTNGRLSENLFYTNGSLASPLLQAAGQQELD